MPPKQQKTKKNKKAVDLPENDKDKEEILENIKITEQNDELKSEIDSLDQFKFQKEEVNNPIKKTRKQKLQIEYEQSVNKVERASRKKLLDKNIDEDDKNQKQQTNNQLDNQNGNEEKSEQVKNQSEENNNQNEQKKKGKYNCRENYEEIYSLIKGYRDTHTAPVDTLGCDLQGDESLPTNDRNFQKLMAIILSVQTKDETTDLVMKKVVKEKITIDKAVEIPSSELKEIIKQVNFNGKKVEYIKNAAEVIKNTYNYVIPDQYEDLIKIKGIGPKVANLFLQCAYNKTVGIAVDTHVHRISNRLEWVSTKTPEQTRIELEKLLDKKYWEDVNNLLVGYGQSVCKPQNPQCQICPVKDKCPEGRRRLKGKKKI
ncbi:base excision DNA repair protein, HhH-GPD family protein (macronuclear) [Tetrahymena thermophila SB210]|uniref:Endonuclease III homolog n=1 Tax=Tetrahymena thermophila (strain SB210) TaxID=312017 RepID=Q22BE5_TETTS|nr:base excision DNA repair protein, HhH-GPD family protein [Tetrahymena thermophila SB210]EAR82610.1 base excision DNA repair protein, HhH-GPD family protein [Tetrahymena thermophila SB210]|eukprot:XP_001030273.1 base excision DNA repair protein, HhH-GPD family protein [Tetrahymena thermophila SB210]